MSKQSKRHERQEAQKRREHQLVGEAHIIILVIGLVMIAVIMECCMASVLYTLLFDPL